MISEHQKEMQSVINACKKTKYRETGRRRVMIASDHIMIGSNSYAKVKSLKYLGSLVTILLNIMFLHRWEDFS